jgi:hypothetical protein
VYIECGSGEATHGSRGIGTFVVCRWSGVRKNWSTPLRQSTADMKLAQLGNMVLWSGMSAIPSPNRSYGNPRFPEVA